MRFLGACEVCNKVVHTYRGLGQHLRFNEDAGHKSLKERWLAWRAEYRATLCCRKCGGTWTITDSKERHGKRCPSCEHLRSQIGKRAYEKVQPTKAQDPRKLMTASGSKAQWDGLESRHLEWQEGDDLYMRVVRACEAGVPVQTTLREQSVSYNVYRAIVNSAFGVDAYEKRAHERRRAPLKKGLSGRGSNLEKGFAGQISQAGITGFVLNRWQILSVKGVSCPREADIKIPVGGGRKLVVLCDGEAFHGPGYIFGDKQARISDDIDTADAYFDAGYSVVRYSESEIHNKQAIQHLLSWLPRLRAGEHLYRTWHPSVERTA